MMTGATAGTAAGAAGATAGAPAAMAGTGGAAPMAGAGGGAAGAPATDEPCTGTLKAGDSSRMIMAGGMMRTYLLHVPAKYTGTERVPLLIDLHPLTQNATFQKGNSGYQQQSDMNNFIVAWPNGIDAAWNIGPCCTRSRELDDLGFIRAVVDEIKKEGCVDNTRVYAAGYSMGGGMSHHLACMAADVFAAVSPAAFDLIEENIPKCMPKRPISVKSFRGTADPIVPYAGGASTPPTLYPLDPIHFLGAEGTFKKWAELNGCTDTPSAGEGGCQVYKQCKDGVEVQLCTKQGGGHDTGDAPTGWKFLSRFQLK
jgi:polyhydroxybutyrate depolymerase